jgi:dTDP-4-amino-4,6-dideoxygalactose transaminase
MNWRVPLSDIDFGPEEEQAVLQVLKSRWLTMGAVTEQFEAEFAAYTGARHAVAVTNCTAALHLACAALGLGRGDEVILPSLTFVATANAIRYTGATPVFADIEGPESLNIAPAAIGRALTSRTRAVMVMHYGGYPCDMPAITEFAKTHGLVVIEDAAHAAGAWLAQRHLGTWGDIGCFSFFSNKNMTTGEGGMLVTDDDGLAEKLRLLRSHGMTSLSWDRHKGHASTYDVVALGYNYRIDEMRSALGRAQLRKLSNNNAHRGELTDLYRELIHEWAPAISMPFEDPRGAPAYHILPVLLPGVLPGGGQTDPNLPVVDAQEKRGQFMVGMKEQGIQTSFHYPPVHHFELYRNGRRGKRCSLPVTEDVCSREVTLPLYSTMTETDVKTVVSTAQQVMRKINRNFE